MLRVGLRMHTRLTLPCSSIKITSSVTTSTARALTTNTLSSWYNTNPTPIHRIPNSILTNFRNTTTTYPHKRTIFTTTRTMASSSPPPPPSSSKSPPPLAPTEPMDSLSLQQQKQQPTTTTTTNTTPLETTITDIVMIYVTVPTKQIGRTIAHTLCTEKLAACTNIIPGLESIYFWDNKVNTDEELLLLIKTRASLVPELTRRVKEMHPYDECEVVAVPVVGGSGSYLKWVRDSTK
jgi:periplasmic divalent cation tolerance protein